MDVLRHPEADSARAVESQDASELTRHRESVSGLRGPVVGYDERFWYWRHEREWGA